MRKKISNIFISATQILVHILILIFLASCSANHEVYRTEWKKYSQNKLSEKLTALMTSKNKDNEFVYKNYPQYKFEESFGISSCFGSLTYKNNGDGDARLACSIGGTATSRGGWQINWAPATKNNPKDSDIIFSIFENSGTFSKHIGSSNNHWTPINEFLIKYFNKYDAIEFMVYGDSLLNAFLTEKGLAIDSDGMFKYK